MARYVVAIALIMAVVLPAVHMKKEELKSEPKCCPMNSSWSNCGRICEPLCSNPDPKICPDIACSPSIAACRCDSGFVRDDKSGECIKLECCPKQK
ncbi:cysteine-rich venom protein 1-like [Hylaeus anthracinus]|uniref:cysteine-rich venom protein 1-like n=1 Tax=Hylaeus anthracinus TaxID=313031 RepID=UPI0023B99324|nr:cysteine-rich venom protein 1-like [Hylaeus anthracinus]XP_054006851.1 cysteine-rich venom protein 1-like [Hylaeus anthracinus]